jgi:thiamine-monophosphate kinase
LGSTARERSAERGFALETASDLDLHRWLSRRAPRGRGIVLGIGDDAAVVRLSGWVALKTDPTIEGVHFPEGLREAATIARKAIARAASDLAAVGAVPRYALVSLDLPPGTSARFARRLASELLGASRRLGARLVGGHTGVRRGPLEIVVILVGVCSRAPRSRRGARRGDRLLATGSFGGAMLGKHLTFRPRLAESDALGAAVPIHAAIDVSDGLALDASRLAEASGLALELAEVAIPIAPAARRLARRERKNPLSRALADGEDYELLLAVSARSVPRALSAARRARFPLAVIGVFRRGAGLFLRTRQGTLERLRPTGFVHRA